MRVFVELCFSILFAFFPLLSRASLLAMCLCVLVFRYLRISHEDCVKYGNMSIDASLTLLQMDSCSMYSDTITLQSACRACNASQTEWSASGRWDTFPYFVSLCTTSFIKGVTNNSFGFLLVFVTYANLTMNVSGTVISKTRHYQCCS